MARIKYGALVESINGSIGGTTFQTNRYGFSVKRKPVPTIPNTPRQNSRKALMFTVQQAWIALTDANRSNWNTYAATFPRPTRLNPDANLNGFNYFSAYHLLRGQENAVILANPNAVQQTLSFVETEIISLLGVLEWNSDITVSGGQWTPLLYMSRPVTVTTQVRRNRLRFIRGTSTSGDVTRIITDQYAEIFGQIPIADDFVIVQEIWLNENNGQIFEGSLQRFTVTT